MFHLLRQTRKHTSFLTGVHLSRLLGRWFLHGETVVVVADGERARRLVLRVSLVVEQLGLRVRRGVVGAVLVFLYLRRVS